MWIWNSASSLKYSGTDEGGREGSGVSICFPWKATITINYGRTNDGARSREVFPSPDCSLAPCNVWVSLFLIGNFQCLSVYNCHPEVKVNLENANFISLAEISKNIYVFVQGLLLESNALKENPLDILTLPGLRIYKLVSVTSLLKTAVAFTLPPCSSLVPHAGRVPSHFSACFAPMSS